jgi:hypothetical protein
MEEITIKVNQETANLILEALKYRYVNISSDKRATVYYEAFTKVKHQIENQ